MSDDEIVVTQAELEESYKWVYGLRGYLVLAFEAGRPPVPGQVMTCFTAGQTDGVPFAQPFAIWEETDRADYQAQFDLIKGKFTRWSGGMEMDDGPGWTYHRAYTD
jgi:hypothetical protein